MLVKQVSAAGAPTEGMHNRTFTADTGITVDARYGPSSGLNTLLLEEGDAARSPGRPRLDL